MSGDDRPEAQPGALREAHGSEAPANPEPEVRPYKGMESYEAEDSALFYGRDQEAQRLVAKILSGRTTVLYAPSGAGKTSLLNARVMPDLEGHGWTTIRCRPEVNPVVAVRDAALRAAVFDPASEAVALDHALGALGPHPSPGAEPTLGDLIAAFDRLGPNDPARRLALQRVWVPEGERGLALDPLAERGPRASFLSRVLRATITLERYGAHLAMLARWEPADLAADPLSDRTPVASLLARLREPALGAAHRDLARSLILPVPGLAPFFTNLWETYSEFGLHLDFVLIVDQFEELFTLFVDRDGEEDARFSRPDHRLRRLFFDQLHELYRLRLPASAGRLGDGGKERGDFPLRLVLSLREEYLGRLGPLRRIVPDFDERTVRLGFLSVEESRRAIEEPAKWFDYRYSADCMREIFEGLVREKELGGVSEIVGGFVEPTALQIVCDKLWASVVRRKVPDFEARGLEVSLRDVQDLVGAQGLKPGQLVSRILADFFSAQLRELSDAEQTEALEILEQLITGGRTRNIVEKSTLLEAAFRDLAVREAVLGRLIEARILRSEPKLGSYFVEITHEFLIPAILEESRSYLMRNPQTSRLRSAIRILENRLDADAAESERELGRSEFLLLDSCRQAIQWNSAASQLMLRGAIVLGVERERVKCWIDRVRDCGVRLVEGGLGEGATRSAWKSLQAELGERGALGLGDLEALLRGAIRWSQDHERESIRTWVGRYLEHGQRPSADH